jgi:signal transduction histidine kinase
MERLRELHARRDLFDALVAAAVSVLALVEITASPELDGNSWTLMAVASLGMTLPLALRRRAPLLAIAIVCVLVAVTGQAWDLPDIAVFPMACLLLLTYSAGANSSFRGAVTGFAIVFGLLSVGVTLDGTPEDMLYVLVVCGGTWAAGRLVHARQQTADAMAGRAELAEREREERARAAVAEERARIARELHDVVAHSISVMVVQAGAERRALGEEHGVTREVLETIETTGRQTQRRAASPWRSCSRPTSRQR